MGAAQDSHESSEGPRPGLFKRIDASYHAALAAVTGRLASGSEALSRFTARRPVTVLLTSLLLSLACGVGFLRFNLLSDADKLWVPQHTKAKNDDAWVKASFGVSGGFGQFLATPKQAAYNGSALQLGVFWEAFQVDGRVRAINFTKDGRVWSWRDVCYRNLDGSCNYEGPLMLWSMSFATYLQEVGGSATDATQGNRSALIAAVNRNHFPNNQAVSTLSLFGGITLSPAPPGSNAPMYMSAAEVVSFGYSLRNDIPSSVETEWYKKFTAVMELWHAKAVQLDLAYMAGNSVDDEIGRSVTADLYLIVISVTVFVTVAVIGMSRWNGVSTRSSLALIGVGSALLSIIASYGLAMAFGCPFTTLQQTLPYILLGIAVDCMFILAKAYDGIAAEHPGATLSERFAMLGRGAGFSVIVTLTASAVAFALGAISELPSVRWFSGYAALGVLAIMVFMLSFFTAAFVLTERRITDNRLDCVCCVQRDGAPPPQAAPLDGEGPLPTSVPVAIMLARPPTSSCSASSSSSSSHRASELAVKVSPRSGAAGGAAAPPAAPAAAAAAADNNLLKTAVRRYYAPFITSWWGKCIVLAAFIGYIVMTGIGIPRLKEGQPLSELAPDDSFLQDYVNVMDSTFDKQIGSPTRIYFRDFDPASPQQQGRMLAALDQALSSKYVNSTISAFQGNWLIEFIHYVEANHPTVALVNASGCSNPFVGRTSGDLGEFVSPKPIGGCVPEASFYGLLEQFLVSARGFVDDLYVDPATLRIARTRMTIVHIGAAGDGAYGRKALSSVRGVEKAVNKGLFGAEAAAAGQDVFLMYNGNYIFYESDAILGPMTLEYVLLAVAGVGLVLLLTLPSPRAVLLMMLAVGLVDFFLFGEMFILSIRFNQVSIINMIMATGLAVDYAVYFAQRFVNVAADGTLNGRVAMALTDTGSAVFTGGITALLGTIPLAFSSSHILRTFFNLLFGTIVFSLLTGLMLMPVLFSLIGPPPLAHVQQEQEVQQLEAQASQRRGKADVEAPS